MLYIYIYMEKLLRKKYRSIVKYFQIFIFKEKNHWVQTQKIHPKDILNLGLTPYINGKNEKGYRQLSMLSKVCMRPKYEGCQIWMGINFQIPTLRLSCTGAMWLPSLPNANGQKKYVRPADLTNPFFFGKRDLRLASCNITYLSLFHGH